jgi:hypothetical protein
MKLKALQDFTCYPNDTEASRLDIPAGKEFEIADEKYAKMLVDKGHAEPAAAPAPQPKTRAGE